MTTYQEIFTNNSNWVIKKLSINSEYFEKSSKGQTPKYLFIGCSDSRVDSNEITGTEPGEMFVHRNIANLVIHTDMNLMSVLQYAVDVLKVEHVIVCGHYGCGGIKASCDGTHHGLIDKWLRNIKDIYRLHRSELDTITDYDQRMNKLVEINVREQVFNLCKTSIIQSHWKDDNKLHVHGWVYDLSTGLINDLNVDVNAEFKDIDLYKYNIDEDFS